MKRSVIPLFGLSMAIVAANAFGGQEPGSAPMVVALRPTSAPVPALKYLLIPARHEQQPGNAAVFYHRAVERLIEINLRVQLQAATQKQASKAQASQEAVASWLEMPIAELPREEVRNYLAIYDFCLNEADLGSVRETCDWEYGHRVVGFTLVIGELQEMRQIGRLIALKARLEIAEGHFDSAVHWLRTGFAVADHLTRAPIMIPMLIGGTVVSSLRVPLLDLCQAPGAPNLYWALANLPRPFLDIRPSLDGERFALEQEFPELRQLDSGAWTVDRARAFADDISRRFTRFADDWVRFSNRDTPTPLENLADRLVFASVVGRNYPEAKRRLIEKGRPAATVEAMPAVQVVALDSYLLYEQARDDLFKWAGLPYVQAWEGMQRQGIDWAMLRNGIPFVAMLPAMQSGVMVPSRVQREIDLVQILEALSLHASKNGGALPPSLEAMKDVPVPADPLTGKPYEYALQGDTATLTAPAPAGYPNEPPYLLKYAVKLSQTVGAREPSPKDDDMATILPLVLALATTAFAPGDDPRARAIAPFLDPDVVAVGRVDVVRLDAGRLLHGWIANREQADGLSGAVGTWIDALRKAGAGDVYVLFDLPDLSRGPSSPPSVVVPLPEGADAKAIGDLFRRGGPANGPAWEASEVVHGAVFAGTRARLERVRKSAASARPELSEAMASLGDSVADLVVIPSADTRRVLEEMIPALPSELGGGPITSLTRGIPWAAAGLSAGEEPRIQIIVRGQDAAALKAMADLGQGVRKLVGESPTIAQYAPEIAGILEAIKPAAGADRVTLTLEPAKAAVVARGILLPARQNASRQVCVNHLKQIGLAMHNYHSLHKAFPPAYTTDPAGKPLLSWRVLILPFLEQEALFKEFHLDEAWDSPHNRTLIERIPEVYRCAGLGDNPPPAGKTSYLTPRGEATIFPGATATDLKSITDGTSNTIFVLDVPNDRSVTWTKPDDWEVAAGLDAKAILSRHPGGSEVLMADGSVRFIKDAIAGETLRKLLTRNDGDVFSWDDVP
ncbi:hypothetical protein OJF2_24210 [Aquisphaera giovannonii]|uniref:DUF1559 domain-containing protein n=1 Tax=Aquisphaera giovannonii TaxID=406548 RepID=A0A5B9W0U5_9BACT|nr:DUF1559 domain-containing protein [Aquisphaera giovannonii]QEH33889.1 hypothetical protein OJF2_24210 [Aquisphaera giovannonii]